MEGYVGQQFVGIDLHRKLEAVQIVNGELALTEVMSRAGVAPEVVLESTYGWVRSEGA